VGRFEGKSVSGILQGCKDARKKEKGKNKDKR